MPKIIKAEVLITRRCNLSCSYCNMPARVPELPPEQWIKIFDKLTSFLGCPFYAIYGAEPLMYSGIFHVLRYLNSQKHRMAYTIITNATLLDRLALNLIEENLQSITVSLDSLEDLGLDKSEDVKGAFAKKALSWALENRIPDIQATATVHRKNIREIPELVRRLTERGIWFSFDFIHNNKGDAAKELSKVGKPDAAFDFDEEKDVEVVQDFLRDMLELKKSGAKIYQPEAWFEFLLTDPVKYVIRREWFCWEPSWVTIDADGQVLICDDYLKPSGISAIELPERWDEFAAFKAAEVPKCRGCIWCTHWLSDFQLKDERGIAEISHGRLG